MGRKRDWARMRFDAAPDEEVCRLYEELKSSRLVALHYGMKNRKPVVTRLRALGVEVLPKIRVMEDVPDQDLIRALGLEFRGGAWCWPPDKKIHKAMAAAGRKFGVDSRTIYRELERRNLPVKSSTSL